MTSAIFPPTKLLWRVPLAVAGSMIVATAACAQPPSAGPPAAAAGARDDGCAAAATMIDADLKPLMDRFLIPGRKFGIDGIPPASMAKAMALQKAGAERQVRDWPDLCRYRRENATVRAGGTRPDVVFLGDSITEFWKLAQPDLFGPKRLDRGISGQTTPQILLRFYPDVVALHPRVVHILAGTNDVAGNTGPVPDDVIVDNIRAMLDLAKANGIKVVLASITPTDSKDRPATRILGLNRRLRALAAQHGATYLDYYPALVAADGQGIDAALANDGLHPNRFGYDRMRPLVEQAIARVAG